MTFQPNDNLTRFAWLSVAAAVMTIGLKAMAYWMTGSVGLLSDALESSVNLVAALLALVVLTIARQPPDDEHAYGHTKAEYFSSGVEGTLILVAAVTIAWSAVDRLLHPRHLEQVGLGLLLSVLAALVNLFTSWVLLRAARRHHSITLEANARHLLTDVWTTGGVLVGVFVVRLTGWTWLDPVVALAVAAQIVFAGIQLLRRSIEGLMDAGLPGEDLTRIEAILDGYRQAQGIDYHALRTRQSGAQRFLSVHIQVPGAWDVHRGHTLMEEIERELRLAMPPLSVFTHLEPMEDPLSWQDISLVRDDEPDAGLAPSSRPDSSSQAPPASS